ncbi:MAG TPA: Smr/MutS family protein [Desulfuromonadales bacterium]|nr:Smr/MutS family protein [Desulfuromonadales bacterium]
MAGGKKDRKKEFQHDPFKRLKGFCVSSPEKELPAGRPVKPPAAAPPVPDEASLFAGEMERLGVARSAAGDSEQKVAAAGPAESPPKAAAASPASDRDLFLASLGKMEAVFCDEIPAAEEVAATPRRMRQVRRGELVPEAQLDLHGLGRDVARERVRHFLDNAAYHGRKTVLIVTGRGRGSGGEPVLRAEIERYLKYEAAAWVAEWGRAPARYGGEGALVVFLKGHKESK